MWQEVESGSYRIDLPAWQEIADGASGPVLDLGCGTGRVAHHLAARGHRVVGIERDPGIAADYRRLASGGNATVSVADVVELGSHRPPSAGYGLVIAPQQLVQIVGGAAARRRLFSGVSALLPAGGKAAFAFTPDLPDRSLELDLLPDLRELAGWVYSSRPVSIEAAADRVDVTRIRKRVAPDGSMAESASVISFDRLAPDLLERELAAAGLTATGTIDLPETAEHVASLILVAVRSR